MESRVSNPDRMSSKLAWAILVGVALSILLYQLGDARTLTSHEAVAVVPAREMLETGDWIVPHFGGNPRLQKPPVIYWVIAATRVLFGELTEFTARLHSVLSALGLLALTSWWASRWYGRDAAFCATVIQVTSIWWLSYGRRAEMDMFLCLVITGTLFLIAHQPREESAARGRLRGFAILSLLGLSWLTKFHYGPAMVLGPTFVFWAWQRTWSRFRLFLNLPGMFVLFACVVLWPCLVWQRLPDAILVWKTETVGRAMGELGRDPWWYYLPMFVVLTFPWLGVIWNAVPGSWRAAWKSGDERERFLWTWLLTDLFMVWLSPDKHENYLLATLPAITLLATQSLARLQAEARCGRLSRLEIVRLAWASVTTAVGFLTVVVVTRKWPEAQSAILNAASVLLIGIAIAGWAVWRRRWSAAGWSTLGGTVGYFLIAFGPILQTHDRRAPNAEFARQLRRDVLQRQTVCVFNVSGVPEGFNPVVFYLGSPVKQVNSSATLRTNLQTDRELLIVTEERRLSGLNEFGTIEVLRRMTPTQRKSEPPLVCLRLRASPATPPPAPPHVDLAESNGQKARSR